MNWVDLAVVVVVALSAMLAFMRGFVREALGILAWGGAAWFSYSFIGVARPLVHDLVGNEQITDIVAHASLFLIGILLLSIVTGILAQLIQNLGLGALDRTLGIAFGLARGALLVVAAYIGAGWFSIPERWPAPVREARLLPLVAEGAGRVADAIPERYRPSVPILPPMPATRAVDLLQAPPLGRPKPSP